MPRIALLRSWLASLPEPILPRQAPADFALTPASADASFRRYFRLTLADGRTRIVMDAPPEQEDCRPFLHVATLFRAAGAHVPEVYAEHLEHGFLLLADLGEITYLDALSALSASNTQNAQSEASAQNAEHKAKQARVLYHAANSALINIQSASRANVLPDYDTALLTRELNLFPDWYLSKHLKSTLSPADTQVLQNTFAALLDNILAQPKVFVHRDYHSRNLMYCPEQNPGVIDFQDAVYGPITYDAVSLYRDAYINWTEDEELDFVIRYWSSARAAHLPVHENFGFFYRDYEWMGAQRQLKVLGIFARLYHRDGKKN